MVTSKTSGRGPAKSHAAKAVEPKGPVRAFPSMSDESIEGIVALEDRWFSPKTMGAIFGLDEKWLSSVREGLKGVDGPPYKKLGEGRSAPIRYNYGLFKQWLDKFPSVINTQGKLAARATSVSNFFSQRDAHNQWLFAEVNGEPQDVSVAIKSGAFDVENDPLTYWLTYWEWLAKAATSGRMAPTFDKFLSRISEHAIAVHEDDDFSATVPKARVPEKAPLVDAIISNKKRCGP